MSNFFQRAVLISTVIVIATLSVAFTRGVIAAPAAQGSGNIEVCDWLDCKTGAISYSQDDAVNINPNIAAGTDPSRTLSCSNDLLAAGFRGTFFYNGDTSPEWLTMLSDAGQEVGSHLASHDLNCSILPACWPDCTPESLWLTAYTTTTVDNFREAQIDPNVAAIEARTGQPVAAMAWACGNTDAGRMTAAQSYFAGVRGYYDPLPWGSNLYWLYDVNTPTPAEYMNLNADREFSQTLVDKAMNGGWEIVTVHDVCPGIDVLQTISPSVWIAPIGDVSKYIRVRDATQISNYALADQQISFNAVHTLTTFLRYQQDGSPLLPIVYDNPVTLRAPILSTSDVQDVQANGTSISATVGTVSGTKYVWFSLPLTTTQHVVVTTFTPTAVRLSNLNAAPSTPDMTPALIAIGGAAAGAFVLRKRQQRY